MTRRQCGEGGAYSHSMQYVVIIRSLTARPRQDYSNLSRIPARDSLVTVSEEHKVRQWNISFALFVVLICAPLTNCLYSTTAKDHNSRNRSLFTVFLTLLYGFTMVHYFVVLEAKHPNPFFATKIAFVTSSTIVSSSMLPRHPAGL